MTKTYLIFGAGYSARAFARQAVEDGHRVIGTTRSAEKFADLSALGIEPLIFDGTTLSGDLVQTLSEATHLVVSVAPDPELLGAVRAAPNRVEWWHDRLKRCRSVLAGRGL